ncbi:hypothetical protein DHEL01_v201847 [Diaporthe helianthi]|uniref:BTB domain-containing protein n=1 Tax=Diaporthe helianthi TaxID=158607 RepID=A0A2P5IB70_DIAHE|nr:hypothetical protein DHEL01_v201847 [Diaporthe helianthi]
MSYADIVQGARRPPPARAPPLPILPPSTSSSSVVVVVVPTTATTPTTPAVGLQPRSYASALRGTSSPPPQPTPPPSPPPPSPPAVTAAAAEEMPSPPPPALETVVSIDLPAVPAPVPAPTPATEGAPNAHLWHDPYTWDTVVRCGGQGWLVHRHVLAGMSKWLDENLPHATLDGEPGFWSPNPVSWHPGRLEAIFHFMYHEDYPTGHYDPDNPSRMTPITDNVAHYVCGAAVLCRSMMDEAVRRIDKARAEIVQQLPVVQQNSRMFDKFEHGFRMALINMYAEPNQPLLRDLRIVVGKLVADIFHVVLQSPAWSTKYERHWGILRVRAVADHKWLYQAGLCEKNAVIMHGFEQMSILWQNHRGEGWQPAVDIMFPENLAYTLPRPPPPSTQQSTRRATRAIPIVSPDGTVTARPGTTVPRGMSRGGRGGRGRGAPSGLVEPAPQPARGKGKGKQKEKTETQASENLEAGPSEQSGSSSTSQVTQTTTTSRTTTEAGPSSAAARDDTARRAYWENITAQYNEPTMWMNMAPPSTLRARRRSSPARPSSSSSALSARAEPFLPGESSLHPAAAGPSSYHEDNPTNLPPGTDTATSDAYLNDPARQDELYGPSNNEPPTSQARPTTAGESSRQRDIATPAEGESSRFPDEAAQMTQALMSFYIGERENSGEICTRLPGPPASESEYDDDEGDD